jgi:phage gp36-like protein
MTDKKKKENALIDSSAEIDLVVFYSNFPLEKKKNIWNGAKCTSISYTSF